ncbi:hypothetical protein AB0J21_05815 [Streptomyces sp. NPDC049954]|uniref:hypothetical protein n=1 Tax=Streptomyces sp. NPDC049954 TaxID=3155779 RepID=UPI00342E0304
MNASRLDERLRTAAFPTTGFSFLGYTCAHRVVVGSVVCRDGEWREITHVAGVRLAAGLPALTLRTGRTAVQVSPRARLLICATKEPVPCAKHNTPAPLPGLPAATPPLEAEK